ncbi:MAG: hypothetical protein ACM3X7_07300 [Solirubrobacterales bacterium]
MNKKLKLVIGIFTFILLSTVTITIYESNIMKSKNISGDIYAVVKETYITDKGYSGEITQHMKMTVFNEINAYSKYRGDTSQYKKPYKVEFSMKEDSETLIGGILIVKMTYSVNMKDSEDKSVGGSSNIPVTFTIKIIGDKWYILDKSEPA